MINISSPLPDATLEQRALERAFVHVLDTDRIIYMNTRGLSLALADHEASLVGVAMTRYSHGGNSFEVNNYKGLLFELAAKEGACVAGMRTTLEVLEASPQFATAFANIEPLVIAAREDVRREDAIFRARSRSATRFEKHRKRPRHGRWKPQNQIRPWLPRKRLSSVRRARNENFSEPACAGIRGE